MIGHRAHLRENDHLSQPTLNWTSFPGSTPLLRWRLGAEKPLGPFSFPDPLFLLVTLAKYSTNRGVFCHVTHDRSSSLHLTSLRSGSWRKFASEASRVAAWGGSRIKIFTFKNDYISAFQFSLRTINADGISPAVPSRYLRGFWMREDWIREWLSLPMTPRAPQSTLVSNLLSPQNHINSDWVRVCCPAVLGSYVRRTRNAGSQYGW